VYGDPDPVTQTGGDQITVPADLSGQDLDAWVSGDAVEGDETKNPERYAAYQARRKAAGLTPHEADQNGAQDAGATES
jgi:hypothetical protein